MRRILPHLLLIGAVMLLVLLVLSFFNPHMGFLSSDVTRVFYAVLGVVAVAEAVVSIVRDRRGDR